MEPSLASTNSITIDLATQTTSQRPIFNTNQNSIRPPTILFSPIPIGFASLNGGDDGNISRMP